MSNETGLPIRIELTSGNANDAPLAKELLRDLQPFQAVLADKAYDANSIRNLIWEKGAEAVIPSRSHRKVPIKYDKDLYKKRNRIERAIGRLKSSFRRVATRYEKTAENYAAFVKLAIVRMWIKIYEFTA